MITVQNELQRLRAIAENMIVTNKKDVGEEEVAATAVIEKSLPDVPQLNISISTNTDQCNDPKEAKKANDESTQPKCSGLQTPNLSKETNTAVMTTKAHEPRCSKIQTPGTKTGKKTVSLISSYTELINEQNMDMGGENLVDQELDENFEESFDVNSESVRITLKEILKQNRDIQQQNREILLENQAFKQQIENLLVEQKRFLGEFGQRSVGEEMTVQLYEPLEGFPLETVEQFEEIDSEFKKSLRKKLYVHLCNLGGSRLREFLSSALKQIMTDKLVNSFTWPGCEKSAKFGDTKIANVLYLAAKKCPLFRGPETKAEFETEMLEVFRSTKQRFRNSLKKSLRTEEGDEDQEQLLARIQRLEQTLNRNSEDEEDFDQEDFDADNDTDN